MQPHCVLAARIRARAAISNFARQSGFLNMQRYSSGAASCASAQPTVQPALKEVSYVQ